MKTTTCILAVSAGLLALTGHCLWAQTPTGLTINAADKQYLIQNAQGSTADFAIAETAVQKASNTSVQQYAIQLMQDHTKLNQQLLMLAHDRGITVPVILDNTNRKDLATLANFTGMSFDTAFLHKEAQINAKDVAQAKEELNTVSDPEIKDFVTQFEQTEQAHLVRAEALLRNPNAPDPSSAAAAPLSPLTVPQTPIPSSIPNAGPSVPTTPSPGPNVPTPAPNPVHSP